MQQRGSGPLTRTVTRGAVINLAAALVAGVLFASRNIVAAAFMGPAQMAVWAVAGVVLFTAMALRGVGVVERFVADRDRPAEEAFDDAFSVGMLFSFIVGGIVALLAPLLALAYDDWRMFGPLLAVAALVAADGLKFPIWWYYRELRYGRQRAVLVADAAGSVLFALPFLWMGWDYWALIMGAAIASTATILVVWVMGPRPHARRPTREIVRRYAVFSGPVLAFALVGAFLAQLAYVVLRHVESIQVLGWLALAGLPFVVAERLVSVLNQSVYPALVQRSGASRERATEVMQRLAWAVTAPFLFVVAGTAHWLVPLALGPEWATAGDLMVLVALCTVIHQFAFPFSVAVMSTGDTRAIGRFAVVYGVTGLFVVVPLSLAFGLVGYGAGIVVAELIMSFERWRIMHALLPGANLFAELADDLFVAAIPGLAAFTALATTAGSAWSFRIGLGVAIGSAGLVIVALRHRPLLDLLLASLRRAPATPVASTAVPTVPAAAL